MEQMLPKLWRLDSMIMWTLPIAGDVLATQGPKPQSQRQKLAAADGIACSHTTGRTPHRPRVQMLGSQQACMLHAAPLHIQMQREGSP